MIRAPNFWYKRKDSFFSVLLYPASILFRIISRIYILINKTENSPIPVICIGNLVVGGAGKTPVAMKIANILKESGYKPHFLTRGYAGTIKENVKVSKNHLPQEVGDESMILSSEAPTWIGSNKVKSSFLASKNNADCVIMDDGFQNPTIKKNYSIIIIDGKQGFGNRRVLPAGPLRESIGRGLKRANAVIIVGDDELLIEKLIPKSITCFKAKFDVSKNEEIFKGKEITAFAGIAYPAKFFESLKKQGAKLLKTITFPDHYIYSEKDILKLIEVANNNKSILVTTKKDLVRIPENYQPIIHKLEGEIVLEREDLIKNILVNIIENSTLDNNHNEKI